ncbi:MAG: hypothetical protein GY841_12520 [FCB group bacterium]|nr:hypothetical protein [FCB group bacterium]
MMRVAFLKDYLDHAAAEETYIPRPLGRTLCYQGVCCPWSERLDNETFKGLKKKPKKKPKKERAVSKKVKKRSKAITT